MTYPVKVELTQEYGDGTPLIKVTGVDGEIYWSITMTYPVKVELTQEYGAPLIKVTGVDGGFTFYYEHEHRLYAGRPFMLYDRESGKSVNVFCAFPDGFPYLLSIRDA